MKILFFAAMLVAHQHTAEMRFKEMQDEGTVVYEGEDDDTGKSIFTVYLSDKTIEYAYEAEVIQYIKTGTFQYNDFLK
jgi:hypothetical protein